MITLLGLGHGGGHGGGGHGGGGHGHHGGGGGGHGHGGGSGGGHHGQHGSRDGGTWGPGWWWGPGAWSWDSVAPTCPTDHDPVLASDGQIYDNTCYAMAAGVDVVRHVDPKTLHGLGVATCAPQYAVDDDGACKLQNECGEPPSAGVINPSRVGCWVMSEATPPTQPGVTSPTQSITDTMMVHPIWTLLGIGAAATGAVLGVRALRKHRRRR
jgi:hypothetical protein